MEENINKEKEKFISDKNKNTKDSLTEKKDDINVLLSLVKCPISDEQNQRLHSQC